MTEQQAKWSQGHVSLGGHVAQQGTILAAGIGQRIVVTDLSKVVVCRIRVAALAVIESMADGVIVIALHALDLILIQQRKDSIWMGTESSQVTQAVNRLDSTVAGILESGFQSQVVAVDSAQAGNA